MILFYYLFVFALLFWRVTEEMKKELDNLSVLNVMMALLLSGFWPLTLPMAIIFYENN